MPSNNYVVRMARELLLRGYRPENMDMQNNPYLNQLFKQEMQQEQAMRAQQQNQAQFALQNGVQPPMSVAPMPSAQQQEQQKNRLLNITTLMMTLVAQGNTLQDLNKQFMSQQQNTTPEHKSKQKDFTKEGANNDGSMDDEFLADVDGDGVVTGFERKNLENFLVTKIQEKEPKYDAAAFYTAQDAGELMEGAEIAAQKFIEVGLAQVEQPKAKTTTSPLSPFSTKPTPFGQ